jgi:hypothetical protein
VGLLRLDAGFCGGHAVIGRGVSVCDQRIAVAMYNGT